MSIQRTSGRQRRGRLGSIVIAGVAIVTVSGSLAFSMVSAEAVTQVGLGTTDSFAVLAGAGVTNTGATTLNGDLGTFPTTTITGLGTMTINGTNHAGDAVTQGAKSDLITAYNDAAGQGATSPIVADLGGTTLVSGVYNSATSIGLTGTVTLNALGDPSAVFVFQAGSTLTTAASSTVALINGAQACNVFWQVGSSATLGTNSTFRGSILAMTDITVTTGANIEGRALARNGAVTLDTNTISRASCTGSSSAVETPPVYAANIGPSAKGLVCPWGGQYNNAGLCVGTGANALTNPTPTPTATPVATATTVASAAPAPTSTTSPAGTPPATARPSVPQQTTPVRVQVVATPQGGVNTGDHSAPSP